MTRCGCSSCHLVILSLGGFISLHRRCAKEDCIATDIGGRTDDRERPTRVNILRRAADHHLDCAGLDHVGHSLVVEPELADIELECDRPRLAWRQADTLEALQLLDWPRHARVYLVDVELHHL